MLTIGEISQNIKKGQSSLKLKHVINALRDYAEKMIPTINVVYAEIDGSGTRVHYRVPAQDVKSVYDIVIWYNTKDRINPSTSVKIYSNSPGFGYNFAYVFHKKQSLLYPSKYPSIFLTTPPKVRNPFETYAFDKHIFACMKMSTRYKMENLATHFKEVKEPEVKTFDQKQSELSDKRKELKDQKDTRKKGKK